MSGYPHVANMFYQPTQDHDEVIPMHSYNETEYENTSLPRDGHRETSQHYRKRDGWKEGMRESFHPHDLPNDDVDDIDNQLPSRQKSLKQRGTLRKKSRRSLRKLYATVRLKNGEKLDIDVIADTIADPESNDVDGGQQTNEGIREIPENMAFKRAVRNRVKQTQITKKKQRPPNRVVQFYYTVSMNLQNLKTKMAELLYSMQLWKASLKTIEGHFGTGVTSYFEFLKWLFVFNIPTFLIIFLFIVVPQLFWRINGGNMAVYEPDTASFTGVELLTGGDWFKQTELYYGSYTNNTVKIIGNMEYNMRFAYILTCASFYVITLLILAYSLVKSYKMHFIEGGQSNRFYYVSKVLCGWDYMVTKPKSSDTCHMMLFKELQEYLAEFVRGKQEKTCVTWCGLILLRLVINIIVIAALAGLGYLVWFIAPLTKEITSDSTFWTYVATPLVISAINLIVPFIFSLLASLENYHNPWVNIFLTMLRTITLNIVTLGALLGYWFISDISCSRSNKDIISFENVTSNNDTINSTATTDGDNKTCITCWENFLGQQFYCLVIIDFIFIILGTLCSEFLQNILSKSTKLMNSEKTDLKDSWKISSPEFNIGRNTLNLIYSQSLVWLGVFYCPLLPFIMILKLFILFYFKKISVMMNCQPSQKSWRGGRTYTIILLLLFVAFQLCFVALSYSVVFMSSSRECGPYLADDTSYAVISNAVENWKQNSKNVFVKGLVEVLTSAAFYITIFMVVCAIAYYTRLVSNGRKEVVARLKKQIQMEGKDKTFLKKIAEHVRKSAQVNGVRQRAKESPPKNVKPQQNGGIGGQQENNNDTTEAYERRHIEQAAYPGDPIVFSQGTPGDVTNPGYSEHSLTMRPSLPYTTNQMYQV